MTTTFNSDTDSSIAWADEANRRFTTMGLNRVRKRTNRPRRDNDVADTSTAGKKIGRFLPSFLNQIPGRDGLSGYSKTLTDDAVGAFFKEMARYPLLSPAEEIELARQVRFLSKVDKPARHWKELGRKPTQEELVAKMNLTAS
jgi:hypothetical protein